MAAAFIRLATVVLLAGALLALTGCGGGDSDNEVVTETVTVTDTGFTDTTVTDSTSTDTEPAGMADAVGVGETATWEGSTFTISDVETSDTDPLGEHGESQNGVWLSFTVTPSESDSAVWSIAFQENGQIRGGDGVVYDDIGSSGGVQNELDADDFVMFIDIPESAVSGAVAEFGDGHTDANGDSDPAYATRIDLGQ